LSVQEQGAEKIFVLQKQAHSRPRFVLYLLPIMMREIKPKGIRRSRHVACMVGKIIAYRILDGNHEG